jgi:hypothetical protein
MGHNTFLDLLGACERRVSEGTALKNGLITEADLSMMKSGVCPEEVEDFNEFSAVVMRDGKLYHVRLYGHDWKSIGKYFSN